VSKENKELREDDNEWVSTDNDVIILKKKDITIILNNNDKAMEISLPDYLQDKNVVDLLNNKEIILKDKLRLEKYGYFILKSNLV
jgi:predicted metal-dependent hydrolase